MANLFTPITEEHKKTRTINPDNIFETISMLSKQSSEVAAHSDELRVFIARHSHKNVFDPSSIFQNINEVVNKQQLHLADFVLNLCGKSFSKSDMFIPHIDTEGTFGSTYYNPIYNSLIDGQIDYLSSYLDYKGCPLNKQDFFSKHMYARHENIHSGNTYMYSTLAAEALELSRYNEVEDIITSHGEKTLYSDILNADKDTTRNYEKYSLVTLMAINEPKTLISIAQQSKTYIKCADIESDCGKNHFNVAKAFKNVFSSSMFVDNVSNIDKLWKNSSAVITKDKKNVELYMKVRKKAQMRDKNNENLTEIRKRCNNRA